LHFVFEVRIQSLCKVAEFYRDSKDEVDLEKAVECYTKAEQLLSDKEDEQKNELHSQLSALNFKIGKLYGGNKASQFYKNALQHLEKFPQSKKTEKFKIFCKLGDVEQEDTKALEYYKKAERFLPDNDEKQKNALRSKLGECNYRMGSYHQKRGLYEKALEFYGHAHTFGHPQALQTIKEYKEKLSENERINKLQKEFLNYMKYSEDLHKRIVFFEKFSKQPPFSHMEHWTCVKSVAETPMWLLKTISKNDSRFFMSLEDRCGAPFGLDRI
jgi:tetratricopeptide (TPR) repeat protein